MTSVATVAEKTYYQQCAERHGVPPEELGGLAVYGLTACVARPDQPCGAGDALQLPPDWPRLIARLAASAAVALEDDARLYRPPGADAAKDPARRLADPLGLDGLAPVVDVLASQLEERLYRCPVSVDKVHVYRQMPSTLDRFDAGSWIWHADGHPSEFVKLLVYLTDVEEGCSAFQTLWSESRGRALRVAASPMGAGNWLEGEARTGATFEDGFVEDWARRGYRERTVTGPAGTTVLFATNTIHRGTLGRTRPRDTLILRVRPTDVPQLPRLRPKAGVGQYTLSQAFAASTT